MFIAIMANVATLLVRNQTTVQWLNYCIFGDSSASLIRSFRVAYLSLGVIGSLIFKKKLAMESGSGQNRETKLRNI